jgi:signal transduction histidine kinase
LGQAESATAATFTEEYRIMRPDGTIRRVQSTSSSTKASDGKIRVAGIVLDVTARAEAEEREHALQRQLRESSHQAGMAEIATGILHNVGNVLNSLGIASSTARREMGGLGLERLDQISSLLRAERAGLAEFLTEDERGRKLVDYIPALTQQIAARAQAAQAEVDTIDQLLQHLREIVRAQQTFAKVGGLRERLSLNELVDSALVIKASQIGQIDIVREYEESVEVRTDRHKLLQIVVNLIGNACDAVRESDVRPGRIALRIARDGDDVVLAVEDTGVGMSEKVLAALWRFGFTTKQEGHGFGLHNSANAAREIGATIDAYSAGPGLGSRFSVRIPIENESSLFAGEAA